ncbi:MAG TPA: gliding motility protein GldL [Bacteroidia bacterium]|jgi:gliding motility-associated protein GldL|nr:gliding motility protein GldL [Bacteroidia bacterium]HRG51293.1 gliding motility protein GldL [Bacteroidia bacterium]
MGGKKWKSFMAKLYGFGAAIVIVGAMFKIMHWPGAGPMLVVGLSTEAVIFFFSAFEPPHEEIDWSLVYPELAGMHGEEGEDTEHKKIEDKGSVTEQLDAMFEEAKIGPELIASLGEGMRSLGDQASKLNNITDASVATNDYVSSVKSAAKNVSSLSDSYSKAAESLMGLTVNNNESASFGDQIVKVSKNLAALNASYELQLQGSNDHLKATSKFYDGLETLMKNLNDSVDDTRKYKDQIAQLSSNLESLNTIYGNMLNAMRK